MNIALCVICVTLMVLGTAEFVRAVTFWRTRPLTDRPFSLVVTVESAEDCECVLRAAAERVRWLDLKSSCRLICVNESGDPEVDRVCRFLRLRYPYLRVCKKGELEYNLLSDSEDR